MKEKWMMCSTFSDGFSFLKKERGQYNILPQKKLCIYHNAHYDMWWSWTLTDII